MRAVELVSTQHTQEELAEIVRQWREIDSHYAQMAFRIISLASPRITVWDTPGALPVVEYDADTQSAIGRIQIMRDRHVRSFLRRHGLPPTQEHQR